jgi:hypothetical protein
MAKERARQEAARKAAEHAEYEATLAQDLGELVAQRKAADGLASSDYATTFRGIVYEHYLCTKPYFIAKESDVPPESCRMAPDGLAQERKYREARAKGLGDDKFRSLAIPTDSEDGILIKHLNYIAEYTRLAERYKKSKDPAERAVYQQMELLGRLLDHRPYELLPKSSSPSDTSNNSNNKAQELGPYGGVRIVNWTEGWLVYERVITAKRPPSVYAVSQEVQIDDLDLTLTDVSTKWMSDNIERFDSQWNRILPWPVVQGAIAFGDRANTDKVQLVQFTMIAPGRQHESMYVHPLRGSEHVPSSAASGKLLPVAIPLSIQISHGHTQFKPADAFLGTESGMRPVYANIAPTTKPPVFAKLDDNAGGGASGNWRMSNYPNQNKPYAKPRRFTEPASAEFIMYIASIGAAAGHRLELSMTAYVDRGPRWFDHPDHPEVPEQSKRPKKKRKPRTKPLLLLQSAPAVPLIP